MTQHSDGSSPLGDYVEVRDRLRMFFDDHPDGRIVASPPELVTLEGEQRLQVTARVYRTPEDQRDELPAGVGSTWERYPGRSPFTIGSEAENAETSAVGRALALSGIAVRHSVASADEVRTKSARGVSRVEAKGRVLEAAGGDTRTAVVVWDLMGDPPEVSVEVLELAQDVAGYLAGLTPRGGETGDRPPETPATPEAGPIEHEPPETPRDGPTREELRRRALADVRAQLAQAVEEFPDPRE